MNENGKSPEERRLGDIITTADAGAGMKAPWLTVNRMAAGGGAGGRAVETLTIVHACCDSWCYVEL